MTYNAGFTPLRFSDPDGSLSCNLWYPTDAPAENFNKGAYLFNVAKKSNPAKGCFGLVMISHGSGGTRFDHCKLAEFLAENGYLVLAVEHPFNNFMDESKTGTAESYQNRSRHIQSALNGLLDHADWGEYIDIEKIAIFGFSLGGFTALTCIGARPDVDGLRQHLRQNREFDPLFCSYEVIVKQGYEERYLHPTPDPRFKAAIAMAPVGGGLFPKESLADIKVPVMIFRAERDMVLRHPFHADQIKENLPNGATFYITEKAGHFSYLSPMREDAKDGLGELANDADGFDREKEHDFIHARVLEFLSEKL
jgi:predicted dienelactone hydrolase